MSENVVSWFSAGCSSFIATYILRDMIDRIVYIDIADQHPDSMRFVKDAQKLFGKPIEIVRPTKYTSVDDVIEHKRYVNGVAGAPCTLELKKRVRQEWERANLAGTITYIWGYDATERRRASRLENTMIEYRHLFPLIERGITKETAHAMCEQLGIKRPVMYDMGYQNNNCVGCVKGGMGYWNAIRRDFPEVFNRRARQEREIGHSCIKGVFLDELDPERGSMHEVMPQCSFMCLDLESDSL